MHDSIEMEKRGIPAAVMVTEPFRSAVEAMAQICGMGDLKCVLIEHPVGSIRRDALSGRARLAALQVAAIVTGTPLRAEAGGSGGADTKATG